MRGQYKSGTSAISTRDLCPRFGAGSIVEANGSRGVSVRLGRGAKIGRRPIVMTSQLGKRGIGVTIGRDVIAGPCVTFHSQEHVTDDLETLIRSQDTCLAGTGIGSRSVVAAGSVVRGKFPPNCTIGGVPARDLKYREPR